MKNPKVGDRVRLKNIYGFRPEDGFISGITPFACQIEFDNGREDSYHSSWLIRLKPKKRREWWIKKYLFTKFDPIRTTPPEDKTGWIKVRECKE